jgi:hypothetical protein
VVPPLEERPLGVQLQGLQLRPVTLRELFRVPLPAGQVQTLIPDKIHLWDPLEAMIPGLLYLKIYQTCLIRAGAKVFTEFEF